MSIARNLERPGAPTALGAVLLFLATALPSLAHAQGAPGAAQDAQARAWPPVSVGVHFGYDQEVRGTLAGAQVRVPVLRNAHIELAPSGEVTFLPGLREYQGNLDLVFVSGGRRGGVYGGGGLALRNTIFGSDVSGPRETKRGYSLVLGVASAFPGGFGTQFEFRWTFLPDTNLDPRMFSLGINFPLWGRRNRGSAAF